MFSHVSMGVAAAAIAIADTAPMTSSLATPFHLLNRKSVIADTARHARMALRAIVVTSAARLMPIAAQTR